jgi:hypothetical protein
MLRVLLAVLCVVLFSGSLLAQPASWISTSSSDWGTALNWSGTTVPNSPTADVFFQLNDDGQTSVVLNATYSINNLSYFTFNTYTMSGGTLNLSSGSTFLVGSSCAGQVINSNLTLNGGWTVTNNGVGTLGGTIAAGGNAVAINGSNSTAINGQIVGTGTWTKSSLQINTQQTSFNGTLAINSGTVSLNAAGQFVGGVGVGTLSGNTAVSITNNTTLLITQTDALGYFNHSASGSLSLATGGQLTVAAGKRLTLDRTVNSIGGRLTSADGGDGAGAYTFRDGYGAQYNFTSSPGGTPPNSLRPGLAWVKTEPTTRRPSMSLRAGDPWIC